MSPARQSVWDKSGGKCWYCGSDLPAKGWHVDHLEPIGRNVKVVRDITNGTHRLVQDGTCRKPQFDTADNKVPACASCNIMKGGLDLKSFRRCIAAFPRTLRDHKNTYRFALRYGLVEETGAPVVFWFELHVQEPCEERVIV